MLQTIFFLPGNASCSSFCMLKGSVDANLDKGTICYKASSSLKEENNG